MMRNCDSCGCSYQAKRETSKFCSTRCRVNASNARKYAGNPQVAPVVQEQPAVVAGGLVDVTRAALEEADRLDSVPGQQALRIAEAMAGRETGGGIAALSKALSTVMAEALEGVAAAADPLDELRVRREARRTG